jgi:hypothetical protein
MALLRRSFKYSLPLRDKLHAPLLVANYSSVFTSTLVLFVRR